MNILESFLSIPEVSIVASYLEDEEQLSGLSDKPLILATELGKRGFDRYDSLFMLCYGRQRNPQDLIDLAIKRRRKKVLIYLLELGAILQKDHLPIAFEAGDIDLVFYLLSQGMKVSDKCLESASAGGSVALVNILLTFFNINPTFQCSSLACRNNHLSVLKALSHYSKNLNYLILLKKASQYGHLSILKYLREDLGQMDYDQECLTLASKYGQYDTVEYFLSKRKYKRSILSIIALEVIQKGHIHILHLILSIVKLDLNELLVHACTFGQVAVTNYLLDLGADDKDTALDSACVFNHVDIVKLYIQRGEKVSYLTRQYFHL